MYAPLAADDEIRLLELGPSSNDELIHCVLRHVRLSEVSHYEAISYCWGDANDTVPIECSGSLLMVTRSLHSLLSHIRLDSRHRTIWADAICINQTDLAERSAQVRMTGSIYSKVNGVIAWLGEVTPGSDVAMGLIQLFRQVSSQERGTQALPNDLARAWYEVAQLLKRDYFRRVWVRLP